jgi:autotransporter-associated beta strand protein
MDRRNNLCRFLSFAGAVALGLLVGADRASAASNCQWIGPADDGKWNNAANWAHCNGTVPQNDDTLLFMHSAVGGTIGAFSTNDLPNLSVAGITIIGTGSTSTIADANWTFLGNDLTLTGDITIMAGAMQFARPAFELRLKLAADVVIHHTGEDLQFTGGIDLDRHLLTIENHSSITFSGAPITGSEAGGLKVIASTDNATITLGPNNTYLGSTAFDRGKVMVATSDDPRAPIVHPFGLPTSGAVAVFNSAQLVVLNSMTIDHALTLNSSPLEIEDGIKVTFAGTLTSDADGTMGSIDFNPPATSQVTVTGKMMTPQVTKGSKGLLVLANPNGNTDPWTRLDIADGPVKLGAANAIPDAAAVAITLDTVTFDLNGFDETIGALAGAGTVQLGARTLTLNGAILADFVGTIAGTGNIIKNGPAIQQLHNANSYTGTTVVNAGTLEVNNIRAAAGNVVNGPLVANGGIVKFGKNAMAETSVNVNAPATIDLTNATDAAGTRFAALTGSGDIKLGAGVLTIGSDNTSTIFSGSITGSGTLVKTGTGTLTFGGSIVSTDLTIASGQVIANGTVNVAGVVRVNGASLAGKGSVGAIAGMNGGTISPGGRVSPGNGPGILHVAGDLAPMGSFTLVEELNGSSPGTGYDQLAVNGNLQLDSPWILDARLGFQPPKGATFTIVDLAPGKTVTGTFANLLEGATFAIGDRHFSISYHGGPDQNDIVLTATDAPPSITYYLSEGATGAFFDEDILIANPNDIDAPVTLTFSKEDGSQVVDTRTVPAKSRLTVHVDQIAGLEAVTGLSAQVTSTSGQPLVVERSMFWDAKDAKPYAGSTGSSVDQSVADWFFAEGSQTFFHTFVLINNPNATPTDVTFTFFRESQDPVVKTVTVGATTRLTLDCGTVPEIVGSSFGISVHATQPIMAERSVYFDGRGNGQLGGTESAGVTAPSTHWFLAEGATGGFFNTFILVSNPNNTPANVSFQYLLDNGDTVTVPRTIAANTRSTTNIAGEEDVRLKNAAVSTVVTSDVPVIAERSMYWPGPPEPLREGHNSFGVTDAGLKWGLAEGRTGTPLNYHTYILLANPQSTAANVTVTFLREGGAAPLVKTYTVRPTSRFNIDSASDDLQELHDETFGVVIEVTNDVPIIVERSMYWDANGVSLSGGTNATGIRLP